MAFRQTHLYDQVHDEIARRIVEHRYAAGATLPNEFVLATELGVSVGTVRKAMEKLEKEMLIARAQGRGTVVLDRRSAEFQTKFQRIRGPDGSPMTLSIQEILREVREVDSEEAEVLNLKLGDKIIYIHRVRRDEKTIVVTETSRISLGLFGSVESAEADQLLIENLSLSHGLPITSTEENLTLVAAPSEIAEDLEIEVGLTIIKTERIVFTGKYAPIEWRTAHLHLAGRRFKVPSVVVS